MSDEIVKRVLGAEVLQFPRGKITNGTSAEPIPDVAAAPTHAPKTTASSPDSRPRGHHREDAAPGDPRTGDGAGGEGASPDRALALYPLTDLGNAERFVARFAGRLLYCGAIGWLAWDGRRWKRDADGKDVALAEQTTARAIQAEAKALRRSDDDYVVVEETRSRPPTWLSDRVAAWGRVSETAARLSAISRLAAAKLAVEVDALDHDPMRINVLNGTLSVRKRDDAPYVTVTPHEPADLITKICPVNYRPGAECPRYDAFLEQVQPKSDMRRFLHQWFGLSLTGDVGEQKFAFLYGRGRNGKGVLVNLMRYIAGDHASAIAIETFLDSGRARAGGQATPDLAGLPGVRMLSTSEPKKGAALDDGLIKLFTGGDPIKARHLNRDFFEFLPQAKLTMQGNFRPKIGDTSEGMWARVQLVPFGVIVAKEARDPKLEEKLRTESEGVLLRVLDGLADWLDHGLVLPDDVAIATAQYRADSDPLKRFEDTCLKRQEGGRVQSSELHALYAAWCKVNGESPWSPKGLHNALVERDYRTIKSGVMFWRDLVLMKRVGDFVDLDGNPVHRPAPEEPADGEEFD